MSNDSEEEELDYHVTFPPATGVAGQDGSFQRHEPVVMLLGWVGCTDKNLAKYSAIYQSKGYTTIRYTAPKSRVFTYPDSLQDISRKLLELLFDLGLDENPIFFHAFSNGGAFIYRHCLELMFKGENSDFRNLKLAGSVLDSAPCDPSPWTAMKAMFHSRNNTPLAAVIFLMCLFALMAILDLILPSKFRRASSLSTFLKSIEESPSKRPQLFLYSKKDKLCDYKLLEEVIAKRQALGVEVRQVCWDDSEHVAHFLMHKEEYIDAILQFVQFCQDN